MYRHEENGFNLLIYNKISLYLGRRSEALRRAEGKTYHSQKKWSRIHSLHQLRSQR
jgi:hypothetical protein